MTKRDEASKDKSLVRVWLEPDGFFAATKVVVALIIATLLWVNRQHVSTWLENVSHFEFAGIKIDRAQAADALFKLKQQKDDFHPFSKDDEEQVEALGERLAPALAGARVLWIDPHPQNNVQMLRFLEAFGVKAELVTDSESAVTMLYSGLSVDLIVSSSRGDDLFVLPIGDARPAFEKPPEGYKAPLVHCPTFLWSNGKWVPHTETTFGAFEFVEWTRQTTEWHDIPVILYSDFLGGQDNQRVSDGDQRAAGFCT